MGGHARSGFPEAGRDLSPADHWTPDRDIWVDRIPA